MSNIGARIKEIRKEKGYTQQRLADAIGVKQNTIATYEMGRNAPIDAVVTAICKEFGCSENWLRTGDGDKLEPMSRDEEIAALVGKAIQGDNEFKKTLIRVLCNRSEKELEVLEKMFREIAEGME